MSCVIDASLALSWFFHDEQTAASMNLLGQVSDNGSFVPALWRLEVASAFQVSIKRGRISPRLPGLESRYAAITSDRSRLRNRRASMGEHSSNSRSFSAYSV